MSNKDFSLLLFDIDGTILDTTEFIYQAYEHTFKTYSLQIPDRVKIASTITAMAGKPFEEYYRILTVEVDPFSLVDTHRQFQSKNLHLAEPFPHTISTLKKLKKMNKKMAAVTSRSKATSIDTLKITGIHNFFDTVISPEDVTHRKPHPESLLLAMKLLQSSPDNTVMVGDSISDVLAGKKAGVTTIGATYGFEKEDVKTSKPDFLIHNIEELLTIFS